MIVENIRPLTFVEIPVYVYICILFDAIRVNLVPAQLCIYLFLFFQHALGL